MRCRCFPLVFCLFVVFAGPLGLARAQSLEPVRTWVPPIEPVLVRYVGSRPGRLVMTSFVGARIDAIGDPNVETGDVANLSLIFGRRQPGVYLLYAVAQPLAGDTSGEDGIGLSAPEASLDGFFGTPLVIDIRGDTRPAANLSTLVTRVTSLHYVQIETEEGAMKMALDYESAPTNVQHFASLVEEGFYDGLTFHRVVPGYVLQGGDPVGDGSGGPGYRVDAEFGDRPFVLGTVALARLTDPIERQGTLPRPVAADSGGSQFFITLDVDESASAFLRRRFVVLGRITEGLDVLARLADRPTVSGTDRPEEPPVIESMTLVPVTAEDNPHVDLLRSAETDLSPTMPELTTPQVPSPPTDTLADPDPNE